ncbi:DUF3825 domain-containing protein [Eubacteriales bacterium OttesenSCG-928-N13]|nr:DUF3825 domain-containing protein [Eubacteriales bacterium OttesenSCG-928-N13]
MINPDLFQFAYVPGWFEHLDMLAEMALPEPWRYRNDLSGRKNTRTPILEKYINYVFKSQAYEHRNAVSTGDADDFFLLRNEYAVFNTGLLSRYLKPIYAYFEKNKREGYMHDWCFRGFVDDASTQLKYIHPLPHKPFSGLQHGVISFIANWPLRVNVKHILSDPDNLERIPHRFREFGNLSLLLETSVEMMRRYAMVMPSLIVAQVYQGQIQYLMPLCLSNPDEPDLAMTVTPLDGYYLCSTCLTLEMAYSNARLLAKPTAPWLTELVE